MLDKIDTTNTESTGNAKRKINYKLAKTQNDLFIEDLKNKWEKAYRTQKEVWMVKLSIQ